MPRAKSATPRVKTTRPKRKLGPAERIAQVQAQTSIEGDKKIGNPTKYHPGMDVLANNYALLGATNEEIAGYFNIDVTRLFEWTRDGGMYPTLSRAIRAGREEADGAVARRLFERAIGFSHPDTHICTSQGKVFQTAITKHYPPEVTAMIFWLTNRQRDKWKRDGTGQNAVDKDAAASAIRDLVTALLPDSSEQA